MSDGEGEGFADDQVPVRARPTDPANIPRVEDKIGLIIQETFEAFIEGCVVVVYRRQLNSSDTLAADT
jgi:DNA replication licensing factor MCM6